MIAFHFFLHSQEARRATAIAVAAAEETVGEAEARLARARAALAQADERAAGLATALKEVKAQVGGWAAGVGGGIEGGESRGPAH